MAAKAGVRTLAALLVCRGFRKAYESRAGGCWLSEYRKKLPDGRTLEVQLWKPGCHRACHSWKGGCTDTRPTGFDGKVTMIKAIEFEARRTDSKWAPPPPLKPRKGQLRGWIR